MEADGIGCGENENERGVMGQRWFLGIFLFVFFSLHAWVYICLIREGFGGKLAFESGEKSG